MRTSYDRMVRRQTLEEAPSSRVSLRGVPRWLIPAAVWNSMGTFCIDTGDPIVSVTYDDGPHPEHTPRILDVLAQRDARATFFVHDEPARTHAHLLRRMVAEGHEVALHGPNHRSLFTESTQTALTAITTSRDLIEQIIGTTVTLYRPPYGQHTTAQARAIHSLGLELAIWSGDSMDWLHDDEAAIADRAWSRVHPGAVLLLHDDRADLDTLRPGERAPEFDRALVLHHLLIAMAARGYTSLTMSDLLSRGPRIRTIAKERTRL